MFNKIKSALHNGSYKIHNKIIRFRYPILYHSLRVFSHLTPLERAQLMKLACEKNVINIVEIGSYLGASALAFSAGFLRSKKNGKIFCIDTWQNDAMSEGQIDTFNEFSRNTNLFSSYIVMLRGWSTDSHILNELSKRITKIDLLFIDGDHSYEGVYSDWQSYYPLLDSNSFIVMHDYGWAEGVQRVIKEDIRPSIVAEGQLPNLWWGKIR
jgi:predicted O-methyltransferase YrrM